MRRCGAIVAGLEPGNDGHCHTQPADAAASPVPNGGRSCAYCQDGGTRADHLEVECNDIDYIDVLF
ncbi:hypothetical protein [Streptomyces sp. NPDC054849]